VTETIEPTTDLEREYAQTFSVLVVRPLPDNMSLAQPSPYSAVPAVVTYGAYESPIA